MKKITLIVFIIFIMNGCNNQQEQWDESADSQGHTAPSPVTKKHNQRVKDSLPINDQQDYIDANRGFIDSNPNLKAVGPYGDLIWDMPGFDFIKGEAPDSVNPSLWRQEKLNQIHGLFKVTDRVFQLRGYDLANLSIIVGDSGLILVDPLTAEQTAEQAWKMIAKHFPNQPVRAIIFTHSHMDHFGGSLGIIKQLNGDNKDIQVIAPAGFLNEATSENIIAGPAMVRRSTFMYGKSLSKSARGLVGNGLGKQPAYGTFGILKPTDTINKTGDERTIDGVKFIFQYAPDTEAPAELTFYLPEQKAFCGAELVSKTLHNLYTLRGTKVRDALSWSHHINVAKNLFFDAEVYFGSHHWPTWGQENVQSFLAQQRDTYKFIHDQTVRMFNQGFTAEEIAESLELPESLQTSFSNRGYYGTVRHNAKAVYQAYLGWYSGIPSELNSLPREQSASKYIALMGGIEKVIEQANISYNSGDYRWSAEILQHAVFTEPKHKQAKELLARNYDQLGYQAESAAWRNAYLSAAFELRHGGIKNGVDPIQLRDILLVTPSSYFFQSMAVRLLEDDADGMSRTIKIHFTDLNEYHLLNLENSVLHHQVSDAATTADATLSVTKETYVDMMLGKIGLKEILFSDQVQVDGSTLDLLGFLKLFDKPNGTFNIVTP